MSVVTKLISGYIHEDDFSSLSAKWELSDLNRITLDNGLIIKSGSEPFYMFFNRLTTESKFVMDIKNKYNPSMTEEIGGLVVYADKDNFIALEEYFDAQKGVVNTYPWLRLVRDHNIYTGYWSNDGKSWYLVGTHNFGELSPKIGIFLDGTTEDMLVEYTRIFRSTEIVLHNPPSRSAVQLISEEAVLDSKISPVNYPKINFQVSQHGIPFKGRFRWKTEDTQYIETEFLRELWGGDEFQFQISPDLYYKDQEEYKLVESNEDEFLGYINSSDNLESHNRRILMKLRNPHHYRFKDVNITLAKYSDFENFLEYVSISKTESGVYGPKIVIDTIEPFTEEFFWLNIRRMSELDIGISEVLFSLEVTSEVDM